MDGAGGGCAGAKSSRAPTGVRGKRSEASERILSAGGENRLGQGWVCGGQFFRVSGHPFHPGMRFENGLGQVLGGQILSSPDRSAG